MKDMISEKTPTKYPNNFLLLHVLMEININHDKERSVQSTETRTRKRK